LFCTNNLISVASLANAQQELRRGIKKQLVDYYTSVKKKLIQSWRYKTLANYKAP